MNKEHNFASALVAIEKTDRDPIGFLQQVFRQLDEHFLLFEIIVVDRMGVRSERTQQLREWGETADCPVTLLHLSVQQPLEQCMNACLDCAIGDYIYEFDSASMSYQPELIWRAYELSQEGNDIVSVCPTQQQASSKLFYRVFNANSNAAYSIRTDAFRLVSRRAINRAHAISEYLPYRKAAYAACGLKMTELEFDGCLVKNRDNRISKATDSLVLYTEFGYRFSIGVTVLMLVIAMAELFYTLAVWLTGHPIEGWTTTMIVLTLGFTGIFAIMALMLKYLTLLIRLVFHKENYLIESVEKL